MTPLTPTFTRSTVNTHFNTPHSNTTPPKHPQPFYLGTRSSTSSDVYPLADRASYDSYASSRSSLPSSPPAYLFPSTPRTPGTPTFSTPKAGTTMPLFSSFKSPVASTSTLPKCFCGAEADEDSIYCSVVCGRKDAMLALCGPSGSAAAAGGRESTVSIIGSGLREERKSRGRVLGTSHYRRVERAEAEREQAAERLVEASREAEERRVKAWRYERSDAGAPSPRSSTSSGSHTSISSSRRAPSSLLTPTSSYTHRSTPSHSSVPSLSSSLSSSHASYSTYSPSPSPTSPSFPPTPTSPYYSHKEDAILNSPHLTIHPSRDSTDEIYNTYLDSTPTLPRQTVIRSRYSTDDGSPSMEEGGKSIGQRYRNLAMGEERDRVPGMGWGGESMKERGTRGRGGHAGHTGHTRGQLSFDDVVRIMNA